MDNKKYPLIFIVEDNSVYNKLIVNHLRSIKLIRIESFKNGEECIKNMHRKPDIIVQDYFLDGINGIDVLKATKKKTPETDFIFLSGQDNIDIAINSIKYGAYDYIVKDQHALAKLTDRITKLLMSREQINSNKRYKLGITLFFIALAILILIIASVTTFFPNTFSIM